MKKTVKGVLTAFVLAVLLLCAMTVSASAANSDAKWITAWGTGPTEIGIDGYNSITAYIGKVTARTVITPSASGSALRIRLSNAYGRDAMKITRVTVAKSTGGSRIDMSTLKAVTFNDGQPFVSVPAGKEFLSDPISFNVVAGEDIAISIFIEDFTEVKTMGLSGGDTYLAVGLEDDGDYTDREAMDLAQMLEGEDIMKYLSMISGGDVDVKLAFSFVKVVPCLASVDVLADENAYSVVVVGDSTVSNEFPEYLGSVINDKGITNVGVVGKGIIGNRLLGDGLGYGSLIFGDSLLDRFKRDVLSQTGLRYVVVKIGANDIIHPVCNDIKEKYPDIKQPTSKELIEGYKNIFKMCHDAGVKVVAMSITPWKGSTRDYFGTEPKYVRTDAEFAADWKIALEVNSWLSKTSEHDGYVALNAYSANPKDTAAFMPEYTIDGIHPSDTMQRIWAEKFPHSLVGVGTTVGGIRLDKTSAILYLGDKITIKPDVYPSGAKNKAVKWSSSNSKVLKVSSSGVVECVGKGTATIICKTEDGGYTAKCKIAVRVKPSSVKLNATKASVYTTKSIQLKATVLPENANDKSVTWTSSNTKVATVDKNGKVTGVGTGKAVITVKTKVGAVVAKCTVTVKAKVQVAEISLNRTSGSIYKGRTYQLKATISPKNATFPQVKWTSSNTKVVKVDKNGKLTAVGAGKAVITCRSTDNPRVVATCKITVKIKTTGVKLNYKAASLYAGYPGRLRATVYPENATDKRVTWSSSNTKVAKVDKNGKITAIKPGKTVITCKTVNGGYVAKCTITVKKVIKVKSVSLNKTSGSMYAGKSYQLKATISPSNASIKKLKWSSSDSKIVKVTSSGKIYGLKPGKAVITCKTVEGGKVATCTVRVVPVKVTSVKLNKTGGTMPYGKTYQLKATVSPENATNKKVTWTSSNPQAVSVSSTGLIKALKPNSSAVITCKTADGGKVATCKVKVAAVAVTGVKLNRTSASVGVGKTVQLFAAVSPSNASNKAVTWSSSNTAVATVDKNGKVTAKAGGKATIYCKTNSGGKVATCKITVAGAKVQGVMLDKAVVDAKVGLVFDLKATVIPTNASNKNVKWTTTDASVAVVNEQGRVVCVGNGSCQIRVSTVDGNYVEACRVTVS